jgi:hypothetical protein
MAAENPFVFDRPLADRRDLLEREEQLATLTEAAQAGCDALIVGPYRHGKTSLVNVALGELGEQAGVVTARVDCSGVLTAADFARRLEQGYTQAWASDRMRETIIERLAAMSLAGSSAAEGRLEGLLELPREIAHQADGRAVICFDEFQDALPLTAVVDALKQSRGHDRVAYIFAGLELSPSEEGPWPKRTTTVTTGRIDPLAFMGEIDRRFAETGRDAGENPRVIATVGAGHPQRTNLLAAALWEMTPEGERAPVWRAREAIDQALGRSIPEFEARWEALHGNERRVVVAIANGLAPQGTIAQREVGLAGFGAAQRAVRGVKSRGVAEVRGERVTLTDPLFAEWLRVRYPQIRGPGGPSHDWEMFRHEAERGMER